MFLLDRIFRSLRQFSRPRRQARPRAHHPESWAQACARLSEPARSVYLLSARDGLPFEEIAMRLDLSVATVECELASALFLLASDDLAATPGRIGR